MNLKASPILEGRASLGEGPVWDSQKSVLHWLDINNNAIHTFDPQSGKDSFIDMGEKPGCMVPREENAADSTAGEYIVALPKSFVAVDPCGDSQKRTVLAELENGLPNRMNDGKCDPAGRLFCGSMSLDETNATGSFYMMEKDHTITRKFGNVTISNGLAWTADQKTLYYIDTPTGKMDAFDYDIATGALSNRRVAIENKWGGHFDGMTIDNEDNLYICIWSGGHILKINPKTGELLATIDVPGVKNVSCCTFGGADYHDLYITTAGGQGANGKQPEDAPQAGNLFHIKLDSQGLPPFRFAG